MGACCRPCARRGPFPRRRARTSSESCLAEEWLTGEFLLSSIPLPPIPLPIAQANKNLPQIFLPTLPGLSRGEAHGFRAFMDWETRFLAIHGRFESVGNLIVPERLTTVPTPRSPLQSQPRQAHAEARSRGEGARLSARVMRRSVPARTSSESRFAEEWLAGESPLPFIPLPPIPLPIARGWKRWKTHAASFGLFRFFRPPAWNRSNRQRVAEKRRKKPKKLPAVAAPPRLRGSA